ECQFGIVFDEYFADELRRLGELVEEGLVVAAADAVHLTEPLGRLLVRVVAAVFDRYLPASAFRAGLSAEMASQVGGGRGKGLEYGSCAFQPFSASGARSRLAPPGPLGVWGLPLRSILGDDPDAQDNASHADLVSHAQHEVRRVQRERLPGRLALRPL